MMQKIYDRNKLHSAHVIPGPAIISEMDSTTVILPLHEAAVDNVGNLIINPKEINMPARIIETNDSPLQPIDVDGITVDLIENALKNAREEMDALVSRICFVTWDPENREIVFQ